MAARKTMRSTGAKRKAGARGTPRPKARGPARRAAARGFRLPADVLPRAYDLRLEVDPGKSPAFRGEVAIRLDLARPQRAIVLHAADLDLAAARVESAGSSQAARIVPDAKRETAELRLAKAVPAGATTVHLSFAGTLRGDLRGLYAARAGERRYAFSQLEAADARRFFPCFDEPDKKARFRLTVTTAAGNAVLSNAPEERTETLSDGRKTVRFAETPPLSTYLVALAVGELEASAPVACGPTPIRIWHVPGKGHLTAFALETARETLARLERYFDLPYPYAKLDLVAVPDFEAGAMENAGAVFFRETLLLLDPATATVGEKKRAAEVICHELAHMWYGDLVTMAWWNDLWLNEAFATWMAFTIVDAWKPEWKMWLDFEHHRAAALQLDALASTHPIYVDVATPAEATQNFDLITYEKGASVVRMIERFLGAETFRSGVRAYVRRHREGNTVAADLWNALGEAAGERVEPVVRAWIEQPGFPLVALRAAPGGLELRQDRFVASTREARGNAREARGRTGAPQRWPIPWVGRVGTGGAGGTRLVRQLVTTARARIALEPAPDFIYGNADEGGFFRPLHDDGQLRALAASLGALGPVERMGLVGHQWALVRAGHARIDGFLELAGAYGGETSPDVLQTLRGPLAFVDDQLVPAAGGDTAERWRAWLVRTFRPQLDVLGFDPAPGEDDDTRLRRAAVVAIVADVAGFVPAVDEMVRRCERYLADRASLDANLADVAVALFARAGGAARFDALRAASDGADTPQERRRFLLGLGEVRERGLVDRALALSLTDAVPTQDVAFLVARLLGNRAARERTWAFVKRKWSALRRRMPPMLVTRLVEATPALQTPAYRRDVAAFLRAHPVPTAKRALEQALERFSLNAELRRREAPNLARWLAR